MPTKSINAATKMRQHLEDRLAHKLMRHAILEGEIAALHAQIVRLGDTGNGPVLHERQGEQPDNERSL